MRYSPAVVILLSSCLAGQNTFAFSPNHGRVQPSLVTLQASKGMGMGMAATKQSSKKKKGGSKGMASASNNSNNNKSAFNVNASLLRLEKKYDQLTLQNAKTLQKDTVDPDDMVTTEYVIAARSSDPSAAVSDWVPVAQLILARTWDQADNNIASQGAADPLVRAAVSAYCRELGHVACLGSRAFQSIPRQKLQYSVEPVDSFYKHVYEVVVEGKNEDSSNENVMTKKEARVTLGFAADDVTLELSEIKKSYRSKSFELHPDRFVASDSENEQPEKAAALLEYSRVKLAYETLSSGLRRTKGDDKPSSWYASLGGRARNDFVGPIQLMPLELAKLTLEQSGLPSAVVGLDPDMVQGFVTRSQMMIAL